MNVALTIAGSDPTGGAGLQADLQVFQRLGLHGAGVVTALTVQDSGKVHRVLPVFPNVVLEQLRALLADFKPDVVKIGMLATDDVARSVELGLHDLDEDPRHRIPIVIDPVLVASDGTPLLEPRAFPTLERLMGRATLVTPNALEAQTLTGADVSCEEGVEAAATSLLSSLGAGAALVTGGDRMGPPRDLLAVRDGGGISLRWLDGERIGSGPVHGTGCALASAAAAGLGRGLSLLDAVAAARKFVASALRRAEARGRLARFLVYS